MKVTPPPSSVVVPAALGCLLRAYELVFLERVLVPGAAISLLFWSSLPFVVAVLASHFAPLRAAAAGYASASLLATLYTHYVLFAAGDATSDSLAIIFMPLWCLLFIGPIGALVGWWLDRRRPRSPRAPTR